MSYIAPTADEFKTQFARDFSYNFTGTAGPATDDTNLDNVRDVDILGAQTQALVFVNPSLCESQAFYSLAANLLTAHFLATTLQASSQGLGSSGAWLAASKNVGDLKETYAIPPKVLKNPLLNSLSGTQYGKQFLTLFASRLVGNLQVVPGATWP